MPSADKVTVLYVLDVKDAKDDDKLDVSGRVAVGSVVKGGLQTLIEHQERPDGIEVISEGDGHLIWTQMGIPNKNDGHIQCSDLDGKNIRDVYAPGEIHTPKQCSVDVINHKFYVCDREGMRVHRSNLDGSEKEVLIRRGDYNNPEHVSDKTRHCVGICVDQKRGKFYWTQKGTSKGGKGFIYRANITMPPGKNADTRDDIETLFRNLPEPIDLEINPETQTLYWTDRGAEPKGNTLNKADISGDFSTSTENRDYQVLGEHLHEAIGLKVDEVNKHIYVSDLGGSIYRYGLEGGKPENLFEGEGVYTGLALARLEKSRAKAMFGFDA